MDKIIEALLDGRCKEFNMIYNHKKRLLKISHKSRPDEYFAFDFLTVKDKILNTTKNFNIFNLSETNFKLNINELSEFLMFGESYFKNFAMWILDEYEERRRAKKTYVANNIFNADDYEMK